MMQEKIKKNNRSVGIDTLRVMACLMVIMIHIMPDAKISAGAYDPSRVYLSCLIGDAVAIFWFLSGCFLFCQYDYRKKIKSTLSSLILPTLAYLCLSFYLYGFIISGVSFSKSITHPLHDYKEVIVSLLKLEIPPISASDHLWYMYIYFLLIIVSPMLNVFAESIISDHKKEKLFLMMSFLFFVVNDLTNNQTAEFSHHSINALFPAIIIVLWGNIIYRNKEKIINKNDFWISLVTFFLLNIIRAIIQYHAYLKNPLNNHIIHWYTSFSLIMMVCLFVMVMYFVRKVNENSKFGKMIIFLASYSFPIYIIHFFVRDWLIHLSILPILNHLLLSGSSPAYLEILYLVAGSALIFLICFLIAMIIRLIRTKFIAFLKK